MARNPDAHSADALAPIRTIQKSLERVTEALSVGLDRVEFRTGIGGTALLIGLAVMVLAACYVSPTLVCSSLGCAYADLADNPLPSSGKSPVAFRVLTPLISYGLGLHGNGILVTNLLFAFLLLAFMYWRLRKESFSSHDAGLCVIAFGLSAPTLITIHYGGYTDSLTYLLLAISFFYRRQPWILWLAFGLNLFNRESVAFLLPWLIYLRWEERGSGRAFWAEVTTGVVLTLGTYEAFRLWTASRLDVNLSAQYYLKPLLHNPLFFWQSSFGFQWYGFFSVFKLLWLVPAAALVCAWQQKNRQLVVSLLLLLTCTYAQLFLAWDTSRMLALAFPALLMAWLNLMPDNVLSIRRWFMPLVAVNLLIPNLYTAEHVLEVMHGPIYTIARYIVDMSRLP